MKERIDCEEFQDIIDTALPGEVNEADRAILESHAVSCTDCSMIFDAYLHFSRIPEKKLVESVPDEIELGMWERVNRVITGPASVRFGSGHSKRWFGPAFASLSAAVILLVLVSVFLLAEISRMKKNEKILHARISSQDETIEGLAIYSTALPHDVDVPTRKDAGWRLAAAFSRGRTLNDVMVELSGMDPDATLIASRDLIEPGPPGWTLKRARGPIVLSGVDLTDGLQAGEALGLLQNSGIDPGTKITRERISELTRKYASKKFAARYM